MYSSAEFVTAILFMIGKLAITFYLGSSSVVTTFGAAGSLVILMIWVYYCAQILFLGAEFTQVYAGLYGCKVQRYGGVNHPSNLE